MKSPVRFMARGLAETESDENPPSMLLRRRVARDYGGGGECDGSGGGNGNGRGGSRHAPALRPAIIQ